MKPQICYARINSEAGYDFLGPPLATLLCSNHQVIFLDSPTQGMVLSFCLSPEANRELLSFGWVLDLDLVSLDMAIKSLKSPNCNG